MSTFNLLEIDDVLVHMVTLFSVSKCLKLKHQRSVHTYIVHSRYDDTVCLLPSPNSFSQGQPSATLTSMPNPRTGGAFSLAELLYS